ncbi:MAG: Na(+)/H(+) antiporter subunit D [Planctomycetes bacterium]|nr:Na(+)/H(+) antiporter subunit D [Planctomycetota bacterium]
MISGLNPGFLLMAGALLIPLLPRLLRQGWLVALPLLSAAQLLTLDRGDRGEVTLAGVTLHTLFVDDLSFTFALVFHLALLLGSIFALKVEDATQHVSAVLYGGAAIAACLARDLVTLFICWEVVAVASAFLIWAQRTPRAYQTGMRYLAWQILSGLLLLAGILALVVERGGPAKLTGPLVFEALPLDGAAGWLILLAFGIKAAFPALHTWLSDAYPEATPTGAVFLSGFTSKLAVYALARAFAGQEVLVYVGAAMAIFPIFFAVIENDLRRVLAYSLINQVGFMVVGVGIGGLGVSGAAAHAFAHVIYKGLLFMSTGAVLFRTGTADANQLGGLYRTMPFTAVCCMIGAASISAFPLFSGFAAKSLIMVAVAEDHRPGVWFLLLFAAAGVFHHAGIKVPFFAFFGHDSGKRPPEAPWNMCLAMGLAAALCIGIGCYPPVLYAILPGPITADYAVYTAAHVITQLQLLLFSALAFCVLMLSGRYPPELTSTNLDVDWLWRRPGRVVWRELTGPIAANFGRLQALLLEGLPAAVSRAVMRPLRVDGLAARFWAMRTSVLVTVVLLLAYLLVGAVHAAR